MSGYEVDLDKLAKRAKMMRSNSRRVVAPEAKHNMLAAAERYEDFIRAAHAGRVPTVFVDEAGFYAALDSLLGSQASLPRPTRTGRDWAVLYESSVEAILQDTSRLKEYDPESLERLALEPRLVGKPTGEAYGALAAAIRSGRVPKRLPKGRALELARLLWQEQRVRDHKQDNEEQLKADRPPFWSRWLKKD